MPIKGRMLSKTWSERRQAFQSALWVVIIVALLLVMSALFAQSDQTTRALASASQAQRAEELLTATTATRASIAVATLIADSLSAGRAEQADLDAALADLVTVSTELDARVGRVRQTGLAMDHADITGVVEQLTLSLRAGSLSAAETIIRDELIPRLNGIETRADEIRGTALASVAAEAGSAGAMARAASVAVALIVPGVALGVFRNIQKRRLRHREMEVTLRLEQDGRRPKMT